MPISGSCEGVVRKNILAPPQLTFVSCANHNVAWRVRNTLCLGHVGAGVKPDTKMEFLYDVGISGTSSSGFGHPKCGHREADVASRIDAGSDGEDKICYQLRVATNRFSASARGTEMISTRCADALTK
jgi:hypothetical protein